MPLGLSEVDKELRIDFARLKKEKMEKLQAELKKKKMGSLLLFDWDNIRYATNTTLGEWGRNKFAIYTLVPRDKTPTLFTVGSAVELKKKLCPWLEGNVRPSASSMHGAIPPEVGSIKKLADEIYSILKEYGLEGEPVGMDITDIPIIIELQARGLKILDGHQAVLDSRMIKTTEEVKLIEIACSISDACFNEVYHSMRPGMRESEVVAMVNKKGYDLGSELVECVNVESGERGNPHSHEFSDKIIRPGEVVYMDIMNSYLGYETCYYRTFFMGRPSGKIKDAYKIVNEWLDRAIDKIKPGATTAEVAAAFPPAAEFGFPDERTAMCLQWGHGVGLCLWEKPIISRMFSLENPYPIVEDMVFAMETWADAYDGMNGVRIEEMMHVTKDGSRRLTKYPIAYEDIDYLTCW
ncbi:MAG: Xaa-Pro peptidase family protein [Actinobacteria bacterium]|nr:Xaa-Pro peptidase family protein [Actinomycetota bacterium]